MLCKTFLIWVTIVLLSDARKIVSPEKVIKILANANIQFAKFLGKEETLSQQVFVNVNGEFANAMNAEANMENVLYSLASIHLVLCLLYLAAKGETADKLADMLFMPNDRDIFEAGFHEILEARKSETISFLTSIFVNKKYTLKDDFTSPTSELTAFVKSVSFRIRPLAINRINWLVDQETGHKITDMVTGFIGLEPESSMLLVCSMYFKAQWLHPFITELTSIQPFYVFPNEAHDVEMMYVNSSFKMVKNNKLGASVLQMDFCNDPRFAFIVILPFKGKDLDDVQMIFNKHSVKNVTVLDSVNARPLNVFLPKFQIETKRNMNDMLRVHGFGAIFNGSADFSGLADGGLVVSDVLHKAVINVNENGIDGNYVTSANVDDTLYADIVPGKNDFVVNRPFIFLTVWKDGGAILYMGKYTSPDQMFYP